MLLLGKHVEKLQRVLKDGTKDGVTRHASLCSRGAQRVLRYGDMEYVMLHLIFIYLMPGEGQPAAYAASDL